MLGRQEVYSLFSTLVEYLGAQGKTLRMAYGNACDRTNKGEFETPLYQETASLIKAGDMEGAINRLKAYSPDLIG